jgi:hypothetical protein
MIFLSALVATGIFGPRGESGASSAIQTDSDPHTYSIQNERNEPLPDHADHAADTQGLSRNTALRGEPRDFF